MTKTEPNGTKPFAEEHLDMILPVLSYDKFWNLKKICTLYIFVTLLKKWFHFCCKRLSHPNVFGFCSSEVGDESLAVDDSSCNPEGKHWRQNKWTWSNNKNAIVIEVTLSFITASPLQHCLIPSHCLGNYTTLLLTWQGVALRYNDTSNAWTA